MSTLHISSQTDTQKITASLRRLVLLQSLWMQLIYYLAESVIRACRIRHLARHNMGCCHFSWAAGMKADYRGMQVTVRTSATKCDAVSFPIIIQMLFQDKLQKCKCSKSIWSLIMKSFTLVIWIMRCVQNWVKRQRIDLSTTGFVNCLFSLQAHEWALVKVLIWYCQSHKKSICPHPVLLPSLWQDGMAGNSRKNKEYLS